MLVARGKTLVKRTNDDPYRCFGGIFCKNHDKTSFKIEYEEKHAYALSATDSKISGIKIFLIEAKKKLFHTNDRCPDPKRGLLSIQLPIISFPGVACLPR